MADSQAGDAGQTLHRPANHRPGKAVQAFFMMKSNPMGKASYLSCYAGIIKQLVTLLSPLHPLSSMQPPEELLMMLATMMAMYGPLK